MKITATTNPSVPQTRDYYIDNVKGIFIFLVVVGHLLDYLADEGLSFAVGVRTFIYFFHMPGFIFMSGYLAKSFSEKRFKGEKLFTFGWLYLLFKDAIELVHFIFDRPYFEGNNHNNVLFLIVVLLFVSIYVMSKLFSRFNLFRNAFLTFVIVFSLINTNIFYIGSAPWYLLSLILWHIFIYLTQHMKPKYVMTAAIIMACILDYQEEIGKFLSLSRTINFLPFFLLGFYMTKEQLEGIVNNPKLKKILPTIFFLFMAIVFVFGKPIRRGFGVFIFGVSSYEKLSGLAYGFGPILALIWLIMATILMFAVFIMCPRKQSILSVIGKNTISIYVIHRLFKDILYYGGFYCAISSNQYIAVLQVILVSIILVLLFGNHFWAKVITDISTIRGSWFYVDGTQEQNKNAEKLT